MTGNVAAALLCALSLATMARARGGGAHVRLNSIRTLAVAPPPAASVNGSAWQLSLLRCISDLECGEGSYCHASYAGPVRSGCRTCRKRKKPCGRDGMCCPGDLCSHGVCVPRGHAAKWQETMQRGPVASPKAGWRKRAKTATGKGQVGDPCASAVDCSDGLCCARHFWTRICKPLLREGEICSRRHRRRRALELFQRCPCGRGLACRRTRASPPSSPLLAAAKSRSASGSPSRSAVRSHPRPASKTRLSECQSK
ncbi:dickkopf-related protein 2-like [Stigmatopora nigra]